MHELLPKIIGGHIALTALNASAGDRLNELMRMFLSLDARIGEAGVTRPEGIPQALALLYPNALELNDRLRTDLREWLPLFSLPMPDNYHCLGRSARSRPSDFGAP
jgi:hypothetical protein